MQHVVVPLHMPAFFFSFSFFFDKVNFLNGIVMCQEIYNPFNENLFYFISRHIVQIFMLICAFNKNVLTLSAVFPVGPLLYGPLPSISKLQKLNPHGAASPSETLRGTLSCRTPMGPEP